MRSLFGYPVKLTAEVDGHEVDVTSTLTYNDEGLRVDSDQFLSLIDMVQVVEAAAKAVREDINKRDRPKAPFRGCHMCGRQLPLELCWRPGCPNRLLG